MSEQICKKISKFQSGGVVSPKGIKAPRIRFKENSAFNSNLPKARVKKLDEEKPKLSKTTAGEMLKNPPRGVPLTSRQQAYFQSVVDGTNAHKGGGLISRHQVGGRIPSKVERAKRQIVAESGLDSIATSPRGAFGWAQIMPGTHKDYVRETGDQSSFRHLSNFDQSLKERNWYMDKINSLDFLKDKAGTPLVKLAKAYATYNAGPGPISEALNQAKVEGEDIYNSLEWMERIPAESKQYVEKILMNDPKFNKKYKKTLTLPNAKFLKRIKFQSGGRITQEEVDQANGAKKGIIKQSDDSWKNRLSQTITKFQESQPEGLKVFGGFMPGYGDAQDVAETTKAFATGSTGDKVLAVAGLSLPFVSTKLLKSIVKKVPSELFNLNNIKKPNGAIGNQGFTSEGVQNILNHLGIKPQTQGSNPSMREMVDHLKTNKGDANKYYEFLEKEPINVSLLPDGTYHLTDGHHRATLAYHTGVTNIPAIIKK